VGPDDAAFVLPVRVYLEDTDAQGVVYNASYFRFMERARTDWLRARGVDHTTLGDDLGIALVLTGIEARFHAPAMLGDLLNVSATVVDVRGARVTFEQAISRAGETQVLCSGTAEVACKRIDSGKPVRWPAEVLKELNQ
jgi:tol-pal system-associated acyl-CoA thioesterase